MQQIRIYRCKDSIDGIFTAIYEAWVSKYGHKNIKIEECGENNGFSNMELFSEYITVNTDYEKAMKVGNAIREKISKEAYQIICRVALSNRTGKADLIYRFLLLGFHMGNSILNHLSNEIVSKVQQMNRNVKNEVHHMLGFLRFSDLGIGILTAVIHPKNNIVSLIAPHFSDRLPKERFIIYDENRRIAAVHVPGQECIIIQGDELNGLEENIMSVKNDKFEHLWNTFFEHIAIKERENFKLQRSLLPLRFREDMTEFKK